MNTTWKLKNKDEIDESHKSQLKFEYDVHLLNYTIKIFKNLNSDFEVFLKPKNLFLKPNSTAVSEWDGMQLIYLNISAKRVNSCSNMINCQRPDQLRDNVNSSVLNDNYQQYNIRLIYSQQSIQTEWHSNARCFDPDTATDFTLMKKKPVPATDMNLNNANM